MALPDLPGLARLGPAFATELERLAARLNISAAELAASMFLESSFNPRAVNLASGATGLIQFTPTTAKGLGTSTSEILVMSALEQLPLVEAHLRPFAPRIHLRGDVYLAIFSPAYVGAPDGAIVARPGTGAATKNAKLDANGDGAITAGEVRARVLRLLPPLPGEPARLVAPIVVLALAAALLWGIR